MPGSQEETSSPHAEVEEVEETAEDEGGTGEAPEAHGPAPLQLPLLTLDRVFTLLLLAGLCLLGRDVMAAVGLRHAGLLASSLWAASCAVYLALAMQRLPVDDKRVLVTGCDTGIGHALALQLDQMGFHVFALCLCEGEGTAKLRMEGSERLCVLVGDVTRPDQLQKTRRQVEEALPKGEGLWGIVNNAGVSAFGDMEWLPLDTFRKINEVNVFGMINATKAFLPLIRRARGRVINVASMLGRMGVPMRSPYVLTKFAVEGLSDCLRHEMKPWGVSVVVVEPGNFIAGTNIFTEESVEASAKQMWTSMSEEVKADYGEELFQEKVRLMKSYITGGNTDLTSVLHAFVAALTDKRPQVRYQPMDLYYKVRVFVYTHCPEWVYDNIYVGCLNK